MFTNSESKTAEKAVAPSTIHTDALIQVIEQAKANAEDAATKTAISEAESAHLPNSGEAEIAIKTNLAETAAHKAAIIEESLNAAMSAHNKKTQAV